MPLREVKRLGPPYEDHGGGHVECNSGRGGEQPVSVRVASGRSYAAEEIVFVGADDDRPHSRVGKPHADEREQCPPRRSLPARILETTDQQAIA